MDPLNIPPVPDTPGGEALAERPGRALVGRLGLIFSCVAIGALGLMALLKPG